MTAAQGGRKPVTLRTLWGLARELGLSSDDLHAVVFRETGRESMKALPQRELDTVAYALRHMRGGAGPARKRTDEGGDPRTVEQRRKIYQLAQARGWGEAPVNGFARKMVGVERQEWLRPGQCTKLMEALTAMEARRQKEGEHG